MSLWAFRFLLWFIVVLLVQPQNRFMFLYPFRIAILTGAAAIGLHVLSAPQQGRPLLRFGAGTRIALGLIVLGLIAQYAGALQTSTAWNSAIDALLKISLVVIMLEATADTMPRVWAILATQMLAILWWLKAGIRLSTSGASYMADRIMGPAVSLVHNPNGFAYLLAAYIPLLLYFYRRQKYVVFRYGFLLLAFASVFIVLQTGSRTGLVCLGVVALCTAPRLVAKERKALLFGAVALYFLLGWVAPSNIERLMTIQHSINMFLLGENAEATNIDEKSAVERFYRNKHTWILITIYPMGVGMNPDPDLYPEEAFFAAGMAHNEALSAGRGMGFPGMGLYLLCVIYPVVIGYRILRGARVWGEGIADMGWVFMAQGLVHLIGGMFVPGPFNYVEMILLGTSSALWLNLRPYRLRAGL